MTTLHFINRYGVDCIGDDQDSYEEWDALIDGQEVEAFLPGNRFMAAEARQALIDQHPGAKVVDVMQRIDWRGNRMISGTSEIVS